MICLSFFAGAAINRIKNFSLDVSIEGGHVWLHPKRGLYWPQQRTLLTADTHFGKEATFRSQGLVVPRSSTYGTIKTIAQMISERQATRLVLLGDMFHARSSISKDNLGYRR